MISLWHSGAMLMEKYVGRGSVIPGLTLSRKAIKKAV